MISILKKKMKNVLGELSLDTIQSYETRTLFALTITSVAAHFMQLTPFLVRL
jgi:hypothetical protein